MSFKYDKYGEESAASFIIKNAKFYKEGLSLNLYQRKIDGNNYNAVK